MQQVAFVVAQSHAVNLRQAPESPSSRLRRRDAGLHPGVCCDGRVPRLAEVRSWAHSNGHTVAERGRVRADIWTAWHAAHPT
ncbi:Lsr2 family DNA-binding protein [Streptomyces mirabilis]|uniref:Lsr2 family DNA-binding protein n=1 Tax=Streptomyces mirabilis TaxID=68239 RepID=UPI00331EF0DC